MMSSATSAGLPVFHGTVGCSSPHFRRCARSADAADANQLRVNVFSRLSIAMSWSMELPSLQVRCSQRSSTPVAKRPVDGAPIASGCCFDLPSNCLVSLPHVSNERQVR
ncbi:unnamed protein product [Symbiodinium natans]|uniref:Uncharacterized protein n=1 Tax=Symbiodinium natans TaxID=878477 RepID=A0A812JDE9_9DINO|nr:unnamed protein product [Symbiodinium natans]